MSGAQEQCCPGEERRRSERPLSHVSDSSSCTEDSGCGSMPSPADRRGAGARRSSTGGLPVGLAGGLEGGLAGGLSMPTAGADDEDDLLSPLQGPAGPPLRVFGRRLSLQPQLNEVNSEGEEDEEADDDISEDLSRQFMARRRQQGTRSLSLQAFSMDQMALLQLAKDMEKKQNSQETMKKERELRMARRNSASNLFRPANVAKQAKQEWYNTWKNRHWRHHDLNKKEDLTMLKRYDKVNVSSLLHWIRQVTGEPISCDGNPDNFKEVLSDGTLFARVLNEIKPGLVGEVSTVYGTFGARDMLTHCLQVCVDALGIKQDELFAPDDLIESLDLSQVEACFRSVARKGRQMNPELPVLRTVSRSSSVDHQPVLAAGLEEMCASLTIELPEQPEESDEA